VFKVLHSVASAQHLHWDFVTRDPVEQRAEQQQSTGVAERLNIVQIVFEGSAVRIGDSLTCQDVTYSCSRPILVLPTLGVIDGLDGPCMQRLIEVVVKGKVAALEVVQFG
jgi:hypothetical protein